MILQLLILAFFLLAAPLWAGGLAAGAEDKTGRWTLLFRWVSGQFLLWGGFQLICVPFILAGRNFQDVVILFSGYVAALLILALAAGLKRRVRTPLRPEEKGEGEKGREALLFWAIFWMLLAFQMVQAVRMTYWDGDDAFYVAISTITNEADTMYQKAPYTGGSVGLAARYGLEPFPIWIAYLARISGMEPVSVAHMVLPVALISMT